MKFSTLSLALLSSTVSAAKVTLTSESSDPELNNQGFTSTHEGAGINIFFLNKESSIQYDYDGHNLTQKDPHLPYPWVINEFSNTLILGLAVGVAANIDDGYLTINGSNSVFYLCKDLPYDRYGYSKTNYGVGVYGENASVPDSCQPIKIKATSDSSTPGSSNKTTSASQPSTSVASSGVPAAQYNATVTAKETKYTTIECSTPTTFAYGGSTYTVSSATTLTVEDCSCTATPAAPAPTGSSTPSAPAAVNGAQGLKVGAAGMVAAAGMLFI